ncbi:MAG: hypothetical protein ACTSSE_11300 [Candidatus Thorarchaeota archaeon]
MSESTTKTEQDEHISEKLVREIFEHWQIPSIDLNYAVNNDPNDIPYVVLGSEVYRGCEAHYFTIADMSLWIPELLPSGDVVIYYPLRKLEDTHPDALLRRRTLSWEFLTINFEEIMERLWIKSKSENESTDEWVHNEKDLEGYLVSFPFPTGKKLEHAYSSIIGPENAPIPIDKILKQVDGSIKEQILELNKAGFATTESCSGLKQDHEGDAPFPAYSCFNDEHYLDVSAHLFTLAEIAGWDPCWGDHGFDVLLYAVGDTEKEREKAWERLQDSGRKLGEELSEYRNLVEPNEGFYYYQFRKERGLFARCYSEESRMLSGFTEELDKIDCEFYKDEEEGE